MATARRPRPPALPLQQAVDEYLTWLELDRHRSPRTVAEYRADLGRFVRVAAAAGVGRTADVDRDLVRAYQRRVSRERKDTPYGRQPHSPATRQRRLVALRSFLRFASLEEWMARDLAATIDLPKLPERLPKPLEDVERERLLHDLPVTTLPQKRDRALVLLLLSTGARISEILRLDRRDWALERLTVLGKGDKERVVTVTARARDAVDDYLAARTDPSPALFIAFHPGARSDERARRANRLTARGARYICTQIARALGITDLHPHRLRHTLGTLVQEQLGDARLTAETLGHSGLSSVSGYTKVTAARREAVRARIEAAGL